MILQVDLLAITAIITDSWRIYFAIPLITVLEKYVMTCLTIQIKGRLSFSNMF